MISKSFCNFNILQFFKLENRTLIGSRPFGFFTGTEDYHDGFNQRESDELQSVPGLQSWGVLPAGEGEGPPADGVAGKTGRGLLRGLRGPEAAGLSDQGGPAVRGDVAGGQ